MILFGILVILINVFILRYFFRINEMIFHLQYRQNRASDTDEMLKILRKEVEKRNTRRTIKKDSPIGLSFVLYDSVISRLEYRHFKKLEFNYI